MKQSSKTKNLVAALGGAKTMLIVMQDNPDPDAIASAAALRVFANATSEVACSIAHGGTVGRAENRALVSYLDLNLRPVAELDPARFDRVALVDTQPGTGNNSLPLETVPHIVIDHHPFRRLTRRSGFTDIRSRYGATSTILYEHLRGRGIEIGVQLATALLYGIRSDTQDLGRETSQADIDAFLILYPKANKRMLSRIERGKVPTEYFRMLNAALDNSQICGTAIVTHLGDITNPDMVGEVADLFLRHEDSTWTMCYGFWNNMVIFSLRTSDPEADAGHVAHRIVGAKGAGGGHGSFAAGRIPVKVDAAGEKERTAAGAVKRFLRAIGVTGASVRKLIS